MLSRTLRFSSSSSSSSPSPYPSPSPSLLTPQVISAMLQNRPFDSSLSPSPLFPGFSSAAVAAVLSAIPRFFFLSSRSVGRQDPSFRRHRSPLRPRTRFEQVGPAAYRNDSLVRLGVSEALELYSWVEFRCGFAHDELTCREMARLLAKANALPVLYRFLRRNQELVSTATATAVIKTLGEEGLVKEALLLFYRMKQLHCKPDAQTHNTIIGALCRVGWFKKARFLLEQMEMPGARCPPDVYTYTIVIGAYCKHSFQTGCLKAIRRRIWEANHMFRRMVFRGFVPDVVTYNCLINGLCKTHRIGRAQELFDEMLLKGCLPNRVTYNSFIRYYCIVNEVDKAVNLLREMVAREHGKPTSSSYTPIIHSLCESGKVGEAREFIVEMVNGGAIPREFTYKLVHAALEDAGEEGLSHELCRTTEDGIDARFRQVRRVKTIMGGGTRFTHEPNWHDGAENRMTIS